MAQHDDRPGSDGPRAGRRRWPWALPGLTAVAAAALAGAAALGSPPPEDPGPAPTATVAAAAAPSATPSAAAAPTDATASARATARPAPAATPTPAATRSPTSTPAPSPVAAAPGAPHRMPPAAAPVRLTVPAARIDQPVLPLSPTADDLAAQSIVPPMTMDAYWLTSYGRPGEGSANTTYISGHSWEGADAPFDRLSTDVAPGDSVLLGTETGRVAYVVESVTTYDKDTLKDSEIWRVVPGRLVLISCFTADPWGKNVVVTAAPAG